MSIQLYSETEASIASNLVNNMPDTYQTTVGFPIGDFFTAISMVLLPLWTAINYILGMLTDLSNFDLVDLIKWCAQRRNIIYKTATYSSGLLQLTGNFTVNIGDLFESTGGIQFSATESVSSVGGIGVVNVQCTTAGSAGNVGTGAITQMPLTLSGVMSVTNNTAFSNGYDEEGATSLLNRYYANLALPITSGNANCYEEWATSCVGVGNANIIPLMNGPNTVGVVLIDSDGQPADSDLVTLVQNYIDPGITGTGAGVAPMGAYCTVLSAVPLDINISANILYSGNISDVNAAIQTALVNYFKSVNADYISYAKIGDIILNATGVSDYNTLLVNGGLENIAISNLDVAILGTTAFTAVVYE